jgi:hypothetical protein
LQRAELLGKKKPWLLFEEQRQLALELKEKTKEAETKLAKAKAEQQPLVDKIAYGLKGLVAFANQLIPTEKQKPRSQSLIPKNSVSNSK